MPPINREWCEITRSVITEAQEQINAQLTNPLFAELPAISAKELAGDFFEKMRGLLEFTSEISSSLSAPSSDKPDLPASLVPLFKALFLRARLAKARELDQQRSKTTNPHILAAPRLVYPDLHHYRVKCAMRGVSVGLAFVDIDRFKELNTAFGHTHVDRHVLPVFMRAVEAHIYGHGHAYKVGGEEYVVLMPNTDAQLALQFPAESSEACRGTPFPRYRQDDHGLRRSLRRRS
jgi:GGDEF domain-containing protein